MSLPTLICFITGNTHFPLKAEMNSFN